MKAAVLITALACLSWCVGSTQARQLKQYVVYIPQQGQQVQVTAMPAGSTTVQVQTPQLSQQGTQVQFAVPMAQDAPSSFSQQGESQTSSSKRRQRDSVRQASPEETASAPSGDGINDPVLQEVLELHNNFRVRHQVGALSWSTKLQASAQNWANRCVFQHSGPGENLAQNFPNFAAAFKGWVDEEANYGWDGQFSYATGHFTQISWKGTTQLGCGYAPSCSLYVCHYDPPGNVIGQFNENVFRPVS